MGNLTGENFSMLKEIYERTEPYQYAQTYASGIRATHQDPTALFRAGMYDGDVNYASTARSFSIIMDTTFALPEHRIIKVDADLIPLIEDTKPSWYNLRLPYPGMFINHQFTIGKFLINGFMVVDIKQLNLDFGSGKDPYDVESHPIYQEHDYFLLFIVLNTEDQYEFFSFNPLTEQMHDDTYYGSDEKEKKEMAQIATTVSTFAVNLVQLLTHNAHEIETFVSRASEEQNRKRLKRGKQPFSDVTHVRIGGELKRYAREYVQHRSTWNVRHYVRGFWKELRSPHFKEKMGTCVWTRPHYRGDESKPKHNTKFVEVRKGGNR